MPLKKIAVSHSGKQHSYHLAKALLDLGCLEGFYTSSYVSQEWLQNLFLKSGNTFFTRRFRQGLSGPHIHSHWRFELAEFLMRKFLGKSAAVQDLVYRRDVDFDRMMASKMRDIAAGVFWGFQGSCHQSLQAARQSGKLAICELATAHVVQARTILSEETRLQPDWADSMDNLYFPPSYERRLEEEPHQADLVISASDFTTQTLVDSGVNAAKIRKLSLGFEAAQIPFSEDARNFENRPLKILYAGTITQRKGVSYLLEAAAEWEHKRDIELHMVGGIQGSGKAFGKLKHRCIYHPPVSQAEIFRMYNEFDVLVLPTLFEGFGLVLVEAMAAGIPVIATAHSMAPDLIDEGKNGWLIPIRDAAAIKDRVQLLRNLDNSAYSQMRRNARQTALRFTWDAYGQNLSELVATF
jgi:glycosyltransferase involved in cell wall biosynthesis